ncbi:MAG: hypothetical protein E6860_11230 [Clostridium sp.]|uniref:hypothetical protein n=1 Tax=Clostridium sp. TaxID=1506 RepID=UPI0028FF6F06|nr:hypothetical protein [Clostridium sp.]MDU1586098.1 hypothetical protein [Clostridium sp.]
MDKTYILTISEGEKTEKQLLENIQKLFFEDKGKNSELIIKSYKTNIYALWQELKNDFDLNIIDILSDRQEDIREELQGIKNNIQEIYLFFDYDGHAFKQDGGDEIIGEMLDHFDNETENGKLYISYPMVEAIKDLKTEDNCSRRCTVKAKENINYKSLVHKETDFQDLTSLKIDDWKYIIDFSIKKVKCILNSSFSKMEYGEYLEKVTPNIIFQKQLDKFINLNGIVAVISVFPFFLIDYFGESFFNNIVENEVYKNLSQHEVECKNV